MVPTALGSMLGKSLVTGVLHRLGYRNTLVGVTLVIGLMIALFALQTADRPLWQLILPLFLLGMFMSTQFTAMNTITLGDLDNHNASSGNSVLAVTQQLSISFGVAVSAAVLRFYDTQVSGSLVDHFHYIFITMGGVTLLSAGVFVLLRRTDGDHLLKGRRVMPQASKPSQH